MAKGKKVVKAVEPEVVDVDIVDEEEADLVEEVEIEEEEEEEEEAEAEAKVEVNAQPLVKVKVKAKLESYIGNKFYRFEAGQEYQVPKNVKEILMKAGYLEAL